MWGIDLNKSIHYKFSSLRFFKAGEHHVSRVCKDDVLLLVYDGILRFSENGKPYELHAGDYHIQQHGSVQGGELPSEAPKYLYVHFVGEWKDDDTVLPSSGAYEYSKLKTVMEELDRLAHSNAPYVIQTGKFYELLSELYQTKPTDSIAYRIANYMATDCTHATSLETLCKKFHFSKNHIIHVFKREFGMTPVAYANRLRLREAEYLIEVTSDSLESIAVQCGFHNYSHFYKLFYREHKLSPAQWREKKRAG